MALVCQAVYTFSFLSAAKKIDFSHLEKLIKKSV